MENFAKIPAEDQKRILDACVEEFALHGYQQASTNSIVKKAGIPKGTLFYFFGSKKQLYLYLLDRSIAHYAESSKMAAVEQPGDLFERLLQGGRSRMEFVIREPLLYKFFYSAFVNTPPELMDEIQSRTPSYASASMQMLFKDIDLSKFKEGVDVQKAIQLVLLVLEGIFSRYLPQLTRIGAEDSLKLLDQINQEVLENFALLKMGLYRES
jgi:AcrR family transcriptional regulator